MNFKIWILSTCRGLFWTQLSTRMENFVTIFAKTLHHRLLVGFLIWLLEILSKKTRHLKDISPHISFLFLYSYNVYFILSQKSEKHLTERSKRFDLWRIFCLMVSTTGFHCRVLIGSLYFYIKQANRSKGNLSTHIRSSRL